MLEPQLQHQSFNEYSGLISFRNNWFPLLAVQGALKSLLQRHSGEASTLWHSASSTAQPSHLRVATGAAGSRPDGPSPASWRLLSPVRGLCLSRLFFQGASVSLSWLQSRSAVIFEPKKIKSVTVSPFSPCICHEVMGPGAMILGF